MANNVTLPAQGAGSSNPVIATSEISGAQYQRVLIADATGTVLGNATLPVRTDPTGNTAQPITASSLPLPTGAATAVKQPALGNAGNAAADVITVQGIAGGTAQPVTVSSGNITLLGGNATLAYFGNQAAISPRSQTPVGNALQVQIGPGDIISNIPVVMDFGQHQVHEGEAFHAQYVDTTLDTGTVKFGLTVPTYANTIQAPHLKIGVEIYNGAARYDIYEGATFSSGGNVTIYNRNRNSAATAGMTIKSAVTSTDGTLIESLFVGAGTRGASEGESRDEWVLKSNTIYRVDVTGLSAGTDAIVHFEWYEDLGV